MGNEGEEGRLAGDNVRGISDAKDGSMHVYGSLLCASDRRARTYAHIHTYMHTCIHIHRAKTIVTWRAVILVTHT